MSSREIAKLMGKLHKNVCAAVHNMLTRLGSSWAAFSAQYNDALRFQDIYKDAYGREIAELTGKEHRNVKADIRNMLAQLGVGELKFQSSYLSKQNKQVTEYLLPRRDIRNMLERLADTPNLGYQQNHMVTEKLLT
ncbi:Rha family transcriptional regulator [Shewanella algae]|uniref:Rha family transcriptional regulator n=1 Tax=Shewanella algae TaxID=38313 RepID=UPI001AB01808|nr:Rha family transcriptional regulator [Shewanella algae]MBO2587197.1 Rha family transcriptional regulator [Shewanella algae]